MTPRGTQIATPTDTTIVLTRTFQAPSRLVWEAMTDPAKMRRWMVPPPGFTISVCEVKPRVGGALRLEWKSEEANPAMTLHGVFTEIVPNQRMVHTETMVLPSGEAIGSMLEAHEFEEQSGVTTMRITQTYDSKESRDGCIAGLDACMEAGYVQLEALIAPPA